MNYPAGTRVRYVYRDDIKETGQKKSLDGRLGTVVKNNLVCFDLYHIDLHRGDGSLENGHGYYVSSCYLIPIFLDQSLDDLL